MRSIPVWDILVRATHWGVAVLVILDLTIFDEDWAVHRWAGYLVLALVALRLVWGLIGTRHARFSAFPPSLQAARTHLRGMLRRGGEPHLSHNPLGALMAYNLWASLIVVCVSGILITSYKFWGIGLVEGSHEFVANWVLVSILLHIAGVGYDSWRSRVNLVRAMISGNKDIPDSKK